MKVFKSSSTRTSSKRISISSQNDNTIDTLICLFCGGNECKRCGSNAYLQQEYSALDKIHSTWINDCILAMQRPTQRIMTETNLVHQFLTNHITAIFNLTQIGKICLLCNFIYTHICIYL